MIFLTEKAVEKLKQIADAEGITKLIVRAKVMGGGCAGFRYDMYFEDKDPTDMDEKFEHDGVTLIVDPLSYQYLDGTDIDYVESMITSGFKFNNPNTTGTCGCGHSFSA
jgi:iron-sulfur cluster insertion protein